MKKLSNKGSIKYIFPPIFFLILIFLTVSQLEAKPIEKFIPSLNAEVTKFRFFESGTSATPYGERSYKTKFPRSSTRYVWGELHLKYPLKSPKTYFEMSAIFYKSDGSIFAQFSRSDYYIDPTKTTVAYSIGWGSTDPGTWLVGTYRLELFIKGQKVASGYFSITDDEAESVKFDKKTEKSKIDIPDDLGEL